MAEYSSPLPAAVSTITSVVWTMFVLAWWTHLCCDVGYSFVCHYCLLTPFSFLFLLLSLHLFKITPPKSRGWTLDISSIQQRELRHFLLAKKIWEALCTIVAILSDHLIPKDRGSSFQIFVQNAIVNLHPLTWWLSWRDNLLFYTHNTSSAHM